MTPADLPSWPRAMRAPLAAAYCGMSRTKFLKRARGLAVEDGGNRLFYREDLDAMLDAMKGGGQDSPADDTPSWEELVENAHRDQKR